jgi:hypothetical protein
MSDFAIRLLLKQGDKIKDVLYDVNPEDFCGAIPAIGDRVVQMLQGDCEGYRVTDRIFETGATEKYVTLVLEEDPLADLQGTNRFRVP